MATVEVDELELQQNRNARALVEGLAKNPRTAKKLHELIKTVNPDAKIADPPADPYEQDLSDLRAELAEEKKARKEAEAKREQDDKFKSIETKQAQGFAELRRDKWTEDGIEKVKKVMEERGILDVEIAAAYIERQFPQQVPIQPNGNGAWDFTVLPDDGDKDLKSLIETKGESSPLLDKMAREALADIRGTQRR
jgi:hypothetical protein